MLIRPCRSGEELVLREVFHSSVHQLAADYYSAEQLDAWAPLEFDREAWIARILGNRPFVAVEDGRILGYADVQPSGCIDQIFVAGDCAKRGVGSALLAHLERVAQARGICLLSADVSLCAEAFFRQAGFQVIERRLPVIREVALANARMVKVLA